MIDTDGHVVLAGYRVADLLPHPGAQGRDSRCFLTTRVALEDKSILYQAPELLLGWAHDFAVDCWGFGMLLHYMLSGEVSPSSISSCLWSNCSSDSVYSWAMMRTRVWRL